MVKLMTRDSSLTNITTVGTDEACMQEDVQLSVFRSDPPAPLQLIPRGMVRQKVAAIENRTVDTDWEEEERYDLSPVQKLGLYLPNFPTYTVDPFEFSGEIRDEEGEEQPLSPE